jgi:hypothetical protein
MRTRVLFRLASVLLLAAMFLSQVGAVRAAPGSSPSAAPLNGLKVVDPVYFGVSQPLRSVSPRVPDTNAPSLLTKLQDRLVMPKTHNDLKKSGLDASIVQNSPVGKSMPAATDNFEGVNNISGVLPPDTQGDVGWDGSTRYYVQWVNLAFQIWDVTTPGSPTSVYGPATGNTLWAGTGTICEANNDGDPITQFDHLSNRWMMSQFALAFPDNFHQCIAVSATSDPLGAWYLYDYQTSTVNMNDYPKFGVWPDGYYMTVNQFNGATFDWAGAGVAVFERSAMLSGLAARMIYIDTGAITHDYGGMLPSDLDGPAPAAGTPNYFMEWDDSTWLGDPTDTLRIWEFKTDWATPANTTFGTDAAYTPNALIATADVDPDMCGGARDCIPQPGTTQGLDAIADRLLYRLQYRDFGAYQTLVTNHTVDSTGTDIAGIHWFELRDTGSGFGMYQEGVYAPDTDNRWMGSAAMDGSGDIALGYSVSSSTTYPSIRYTGRLSTDPSGTLPQGEAELIAGGGSQTHSAARWGDYSMLAVDSEDDCTFWYTQEYIQTTGSAPWQTRIGSFKFPSCTTAPTGLLTGAVTDTAAAPIAGATVEVSGGYTTITDGLGKYTLNLVAGSYDVTASKYGYLPGTVSGVGIVPPGTTTQDFTLAAAPASTISGVVTDATTGWPLYARLDIFGFPGSPVFTDPVTGAYSVSLIDGPYTFTVSALSGGYTPAVQALVVSGDATQDFALAADLAACTAPGYQPSPPVISQAFETFPPSGWTLVDNVAGGGLVWDTNTYYGDDNYTGGSGLAATVDSNNNSDTPYDTELRSPIYDPASFTSLILTYSANFQSYSGLDALDLDISNDSGTTWVNVIHWNTDHGTLYDLPGEAVAVDLAPFVTGNFMLRWYYYSPEASPWDWYAQVDDVALGAGCQPVASAGLVVGVVRDANTGDPVANPVIVDGAANHAVFVNNIADPGQPHPTYILAEPAGPVTLTASALKYGDDTRTPTMIAGDTIRQDFSLAAGILAANPTSLSYKVGVDGSASLPLALNNTGGASADFDVYAIPGTFAGYAATGPFASHTRHTGPKNLNDKNASKLRILPDVPAAPAWDGGQISAAWPTGLTYAWGIGFDTDADDLWLGNIAAGGGDDLDYRFTTTGVNTGDTIDTAPWIGSWAADMAYDPFTGKLWQLNVGGDNCVHELDPDTLTSTGNTICAPFGTSERGLTYDPVTNTYYAGSWNDSILNHFAPDGTLLDSKNVNLSISGLAFNPASGHLFVMANHTFATAGLFDVYVLDALDSYNILGAFNLMNGTANAFGNFAQAGLEMDCDGNLWAVDQTAQQVYVADSGETGACDWASTWLSTVPDTGTVAASGSASLSADADAIGLPVGTYQAYLRVVGNTPYGDAIIPAKLVVDAAPVAAGQAVTTPEDTAVDITLTASDADGDALTFSIVDGPVHGVLTGAPPAVTYTPAANYSGPDSFTFKANDGTVDGNTAMVDIIVTPVNDAPLAADQPVSTAEDTAIGITLTATDVDGDPLAYAIVAGPTHGALSGTAPALTYTPAANYNGPDSFTFKANDGTVDGNTATVSITVTPVNDAPVAADQTLTTAEDVPLVITLSATDVDSNPLTYTVVAGPWHGILTGAAPALTYTPDANYHGPDGFTFRANDGTVDSGLASVNITVTSVNDAPVITSNGGGATADINVPENTTAVTTVTATDADEDVVTYSISGGADALLFTISASTGELAFLSSPDYENPLDAGGNNTYEVIVQVSDGLLTDTQTITVTVTDVEEFKYLYLPLIFK